MNAQLILYIFKQTSKTTRRTQIISLLIACYCDRFVLCFTRISYYNFVISDYGLCSNDGLRPVLKPPVVVILKRICSFDPFKDGS